MGCYSWKFADTNNRRRLIIGRKAYVLCPDGTVLYEPCYDGYGTFAGRDIYALAADWNRDFLSKNPDFLIKRENKTVSSYKWYPSYSDMTLSPTEIGRKLKEAGLWYEYRDIGIAIACGDMDNEALPYPIKICQSRPEGSEACYQELPASKSDYLQGCY